MKNRHYETPKMKRLLRWLVWRSGIEARKNAALTAMVNNVRFNVPAPYVLYSHVSDPLDWTPEPPR